MGKVKQAFDDVAPDAKMKKGFLQATKYLNEHLNPGEHPIFRAHLSWIPIFVRQIPFMLVGSLIGGVVGGVMGNLLIGVAIALGIWIIGALAQVGQIYKNIATDILLTNQGIHSKRKLFAVEDDQFSRYAVINDARLTYNSIFQRMFQYGDIEIETIGNDANFEYKCLAKPMAFKQAVRAAQQRFSIQGAMAAGVAAGIAPGRYDDGYDDYDGHDGYDDEYVEVPQSTRRRPTSNGKGSPNNRKAASQQQYQMTGQPRPNIPAGSQSNRPGMTSPNGMTGSNKEKARQMAQTKRYASQARTGDANIPPSMQQARPATSGPGRQRKSTGQRRRRR